MNDKEKEILHLKWIITILLVIFIFSSASSIALCFFNNDEAIRLISIAGSIISGLLALLAIIYAFIYNKEINRNITGLNVASDRVSKVIGKLKTIPKEVKEAIQKEIAPVKDQLEEQKEVFNKINKTKQITAVPTAAPKKQIKIEDISKKYLKVISTHGLMTLYIANLALERKKPFKFEDLTKNLNLNFYYAYGFFMASAGMDFINYKLSNQILTITYVEKNIKKEIKEALYKRIDEIENKNKAFGIEFRKEAKNIETYFSKG